MKLFFECLSITRIWILGLIFLSSFKTSFGSTSCVEKIKFIIAREAHAAKVAAIKKNIAHPEVPSVYELRITTESPQEIERSIRPSSGVSDLVIEMARDFKLYDDFKKLSDLKPNQEHSPEVYLSTLKKISETNSQREKARIVKDYINAYFNSGTDLIKILNSPELAPNLKLPDSHPQAQLLNHIEKMWSRLARKTTHRSDNSIIELPYEFLVPNETRFDEIYYWDSYFGIKGLLATGRLDISQKMVENFLYLKRQFGIIPNGNRDYYLTRSQPPFISSMVREVFEKTFSKARTRREKERLLRWLKERAYPLLKTDLEDFWGNPNTRKDQKSGLYHYFDETNLPRPERHSADKELADSLNDDHGLGLTYQDTRAVAESGLDFSVTLSLEATQVAPVLLNSILYKTMKDLEWMAKTVGNTVDAKKYFAQAEKMKSKMMKYLWNSESGLFFNYHIKNQNQIKILSAETFIPLYAKAVDQETANKIVKNLSLFLEEGGIISSGAMDSFHQWDGVNGWAPLQMMCIEGLLNYGYKEEAEEVAKRWLNANTEIFNRENAIFERINVRKKDIPTDDGDKYPVQKGFLWTNSSLIWIMKDVLNIL